MENSSEFGSPSQGRSPWEPFLPILRFVEKQGYVLLKDRQKRKWMWVIFVGLASIQNYFVRELLVALFFFTILYVILAALVVLYILIVDGLDYGSVWVESLGRSLLSLVHHHFASPARLPSPTRRATAREERFDQHRLAE